MVTKDLEIKLYVNSSLASLLALSHLSKQGIPYTLFESSLHHPNAIILQRVPSVRRPQNASFLQLNSKTILIIFEDITESLLTIIDSIQNYRANGIRCILILQGINDLIEANSFTHSNSLTEEFLADIMIHHIDMLETDSAKETAEWILRILTSLNEGPYRKTHSIFHLPGKKLQQAFGVTKGAQHWATVLVNIPGVSESKAQCILQHFPTLPALMEKYLSDSSKKSKEELLAYVIDDRKHLKLSKRVYNYFTSVSPDSLVI